MLRALAIALTAVGVFSATAQALGLQASQTVELATVSVAPDGQEILTYQPATDVEPGEQVRYTLSFANEAPEAAENVALVMPVPSEVSYIEGSAQGPDGALLFSADAGQTFALRDQVQVSDGGAVRLAAATEITHIKWQFSAPISPAETGAVRFSAVLK